jgi:hypothetical protein
MNRWRVRLAELCNPRQEDGAVQVVQNVQNFRFEHSEHFEQRGEPDRPSAHRWTDAHDERASIIEHDGGAPREWAEALARLDPASPPGDVPPKRWVQFIDDCGHFIDSGWAERAAELGWTPFDLFGCDRFKPFARVDRCGLLWLLDRGQLRILTADTAVINKANGASTTFYKGPHEPDQVLAWEFAP